MTLDNHIISFKYVFIITLLLFFYSCKNNNPVTISGNTMGTTYTIKINSNNDINKELIQSKINNILNSINMVFSTYIVTSEISQINYSPKLNHTISNTLHYVLNKSLYYSKLSNGYFDPTVFPLVDLWGFGPTEKTNRPDGNLIALTKKYVSYKNLLLDDKNNLIKQSSNIFIDLSSIAKGYAVDVLSDYLQSLKLDDFMVDIGGELKCRGQNNHSDWIIGVNNPINNEIFVKTKINDRSIATSGTYNNFLIYDGIEYSHIINPKTGYPIVNPILSSTVIADKCIDADALATMLMVLSPKEGLKIINSINNVDCLIIIKDDDKIIKIMSDGFEEYIVN